jgi:hypothetical protein
MANSTDMKNVAAGLAALSICESLLLALTDLNVIGKKEAGGILADAAAVHRGAVPHEQDMDMQLEVAAIIDRIIVSGNSVPRP